MPRRLLERRYYLRAAERRARLGPGVTARWTLPSGVGFIDYWPDIPATIPEKMVFAELIRLEVNFYFSWYFGDLKVTPDKRERYRPDFWLPDYNIIIEVYGTYWHTRPGKFEQDALRAFFLQAEGYKTYILSDKDVIRGVSVAIQENIPELNPPMIRGGTFHVGDRPFDPTASIRARLGKWPRMLSAKYVRKTERMQAPSASWRTPQKTLRPADPVDPMFTGLDDVLIAQAIEYGDAYRQWESEYNKWKAQYG